MKAVICIPTMGTSVGLHIFRLLATLPKGVGFEVVNNLTPVEFARNELAKKFLKHSGNPEWLLFVDSDMLPPMDWPKIFEHDADLVSGRAFAYTNHPRPTLRVAAMTNGEQVMGGAGVCEVDMVGTGFLAVRRRVFEDPKMRLPLEYTTYKGEKAKCEGPLFFRNIRKADGSIDCSEDYEFCIRAKANGYKIVIDFDLPVGHIKEINLDEMAVYASKVAEAYHEKMKEGGI